MRVLAVAGSLRRGSYNRALVRAAEALIPHEYEVRLFRGLAALPPYNEDNDREPPPATVRRLRSAISRSDCLIFSTPEYNGSVPGVLKNAIDWASRPFPNNCLRGKPTLVVGASSGFFGAVWAQGDLRRILKVAGARVIAHEMPPIRAEYSFDGRGRLTSDEAKAALASAIETLLAETDRDD